MAVGGELRGGGEAGAQQNLSSTAILRPLPLHRALRQGAVT